MVIMIGIGARGRGVSRRLEDAGCRVVETNDLAGILGAAPPDHRDAIIFEATPHSVAHVAALARELREQDGSVPLVLWPTRAVRLTPSTRAPFSETLESELTAADVFARVRRWVPALGGADGDGTETPAGAPDLIGGERLVGETPAIKAVRNDIRLLAAADCNILITGETGTGKELVAELIHRNSPRRNGPLVALNCAAIPDTLLESELFGYEQGAFTGASRRREGLLKRGHGGTVFLDEIGDMSLQAQAKILRAIEAKEVQRLGGLGGVSIDIRIVAATNQDLQRLIAEGLFRRDLYFRLSVARIDLPPLRERRADIRPLTEEFLRALNRRLGQAVESMTDQALEHLVAYDWPGNVRELKHLLESMYVMRPPRVLACQHLPAWFGGRRVRGHECVADERARLVWALRETNWNKSKAAQRLRVSRMTLYRRIMKYQLTEVEATGNARPGSQP